MTLNNANIGQKPSSGRTDELVTTMSTNVRLQFLATKAKLKQGYQIQ